MEIGDLEKRLGQGSFAHWTDDRSLHIVARAKEQPSLCCSIQRPLTRVGSTDLWVISLHVPRLDEAVIGLGLTGGESGYRSFGEFRGVRAPAAPKRSDPLLGRLHTIVVDSRFADAPRDLLIYDPPVTAGRPRAIVYLADGTVESFASVVEPLVLERRLPPVRIVGLMHWKGPADTPAARSDHRNGEYVLGFNPSLKARHDRFFLEEVISLSEADLLARGLRRLTAGQSGGGAWALTTALENPSVIWGSIAMSPAIKPDRYANMRPGKEQRYFLVGGQLEGYGNADTAYEHLVRSGATACLSTPLDGHSMTMYQAFFPLALEAALSGGPCPRLGP